jgi:hypothetical protein
MSTSFAWEMIMNKGLKLVSNFGGGGFSGT